MAQHRHIYKSKHRAVDAVIGRAVRPHTHQIVAAVTALELPFGDCQIAENLTHISCQRAVVKSVCDVKQRPVNVGRNQVEYLGSPRCVALQAQAAVNKNGRDV